MYEQDIILMAGDKAATKYRKAILLIKNPDNFRIQGNHNHIEKIDEFLNLVNIIYGSFSVMNSFDHAEVIKHCFLANPNHTGIEPSRHLKHIVGIRGKARKELKQLIVDILKFSNTVNEIRYQ